MFFAEHGVNPFVDTEDDRLSTFGLEVDTGSYTVARRYLRDGNLPPREAVRVEELRQRLQLRRPRSPRRGDFALSAEGAPSPFGEGERYAVLRFAVKGRVVDRDQRKPAVLTFVVDVSGSMDRGKPPRPGQAGALRAARPAARGRPGRPGGLRLAPARCCSSPPATTSAIRSAIDRLSSGGSTNAEEGLVLGYDLAAPLPRRRRASTASSCARTASPTSAAPAPSRSSRGSSATPSEGIELTTVGFGMGNYNDVLMEQLADAGDGRYAYVDTLSEARRAVRRGAHRHPADHRPRRQGPGRLRPAQVVTRYRLLGYENRDIADERLPRRHRGRRRDRRRPHRHRPLRGQAAARGIRAATPSPPCASATSQWADGDDEAVELERALRVKDLAPSWDARPPALRLASLVGEYGELLKGTYWAKEGDMAEVQRHAQALQADFPGDARVADFAAQVSTAARLLEQKPQQ